MINQIQFGNVDLKTPLKDLESSPNGPYLMLPARRKRAIGSASEREAREERERRHKKDIAKYALGIGFGIFFLSKVLGSGGLGRFLKWTSESAHKLGLTKTEKAAKKVEESYGRVHDRVHDKTSKFISKGELINNFVNLKDTWIKKVMFAWGPTKKIHEEITQKFINWGRNAVRKSFGKADAELGKVYSYLNGRNEKILLKERHIWPKGVDVEGHVKELQKLLDATEAIIEKGFGTTSQHRHFKATEIIGKELEAKFLHTPMKELIKDKEMYRDFVADKFISDSRTNRIKVGEETLRDLRDHLDRMLKLYKDILQPSKYKKVEGRINGMYKRYEKANQKITHDYFNMFRDIKLGSGPTDVLNLLLTAAAAGYGLAQCEDAEERTSLSLLYGIPIVGGVATSLICTSRLMAGSRALVAGAISGFVLNRIGEQVDSTRKKYKPHYEQIMATLKQANTTQNLQS